MKHEDINEVFDASFRIIGDKLVTDEISSLMKIQPDYSHQKGAPNNRKSKSGRIIVGRPHKTGIWSINSNLPESSSLEEHITGLLERLEPSSDAIKRLSKEGYRVDIYCGYFSKPGTQGGFDISPSVLERMGKMGISLAVSTFEL